MTADHRLRVCLIGATSRWASGIYVPALVAAADAWRVMALLDLESTAASSHLAFEPAPICHYSLTGHWSHDREVLNAMDGDCTPDLVIVSTSPDSHFDYAQWSLGKGADIILDKPPVDGQHKPLCRGH